MKSSETTKKVDLKAKRVLRLQLLMLLVVSGAFFLAMGLQAAQAAAFGSLVSMASTLLLSRGIKQATGMASSQPGKSTAVLYVGAAQRFLMVLAAFAFGLAVIKLYPLGMFAGFAAAQMAYLVSMYYLRGPDE